MRIDASRHICCRTAYTPRDCLELGKVVIGSTARDELLEAGLGHVQIKILQLLVQLIWVQHGCFFNYRRSLQDKNYGSISKRCHRLTIFQSPSWES